MNTNTKIKRMVLNNKKKKVSNLIENYLTIYQLFVV